MRRKRRQARKRAKTKEDRQYAYTRGVTISIRTRMIISHEREPIRYLDHTWEKSNEMPKVRRLNRILVESWPIISKKKKFEQIIEK